VVKRRLSAWLETVTDFSLLIGSQASYPLDQISSSCLQTSNSATCTRSARFKRFATSAALPERGPRGWLVRLQRSDCRGSKALAINVPISAAQPRGEAPGLSEARVVAIRTSRLAGGIDNQNDTTAAVLLQFAYTFGTDTEVSIQRPGKLGLDVTVVRHVQRGSHRCLHIAASLAAFSR
jgi:hypothetical protein